MLLLRIELPLFMELGKLKIENKKSSVVLLVIADGRITFLFVSNAYEA